MKIHKEGRKIIAVSAIIISLMALAVLLLVPSYHWALYVVLAFLLLFFLWIGWFFRSPRRSINRQEDAFLSPADGRIVFAGEVREAHHIGKVMQKVSIFMSPLNVHLNRYPADGRILSYQYFPGKYLVAWHPKSSDMNERNAIVVETSQGAQIMLSQIAGTVARRIVCYGSEGKEVRQGEELGFIKFGSRVDLYLPKDVQVMVKPGDKVKAGLDTLAKAEWAEPNP